MFQGGGGPGDLSPATDRFRAVRCGGCRHGGHGDGCDGNVPTQRRYGLADRRPCGEVRRKGLGRRGVAGAEERCRPHLCQLRRRRVALYGVQPLFRNGIRGDSRLAEPNLRPEPGSGRLWGDVHGAGDRNGDDSRLGTPAVFDSRTGDSGRSGG